MKDEGNISGNGEVEEHYRNRECLSKGMEETEECVQKATSVWLAFSV